MAASLQKIATKIRRLTNSLDNSSVSDAQIYDYVDDFVLYDMPARIKLSILNQSLKWTCDPNIGTYDLNNTSSVSALVDFDEKYNLIDEPIYVSGHTMKLFWDESLFYSSWPRIHDRVKIGTGDGVTTQFTHTLIDVPIEQRFVMISAIGANNAKIVAEDTPINTETGTWFNPETGLALVPPGSLNYLTGAIDVTLSSPPKADSDVEIHFHSYSTGLPSSILYYQNQFVLRPIPDRPYEIRLRVQKRPSSLGTNPNNVPELEQWWQYIAYGAALKLLKDRTDNELSQMLIPDFETQEELVLNRTIRQIGRQRTYTPYADQAENKVPFYDGTFYNGRNY